MKTFFATCLLLLCVAQASAQTTAQIPAADAQLTAQVNAFVDSWHDDAANTRMAYFEKMAPDGVYIGTDKTELWHRAAFKVWAKPYFDSKKAWTFKATRRNVYWSPDRKVIWFDELLDTQMGVCQASGVLHPTANGFAIDHYQLSMAVPNDVAAAVTKTIKQFEAAPAAQPAAK